MGVSFSEKNTVSMLKAGSLAAREGQLLVGDVVIAVDSSPLKGERVGTVMNLKPMPRYKLTIARQAAGAAERAQGEQQGWLTYVKAKDGSALHLQWPRKYWLVLEPGRRAQIVLYERSRGGKQTRAVPLKGAVCKTPVMALKGKELKQPPVIASFITQRKFPFTLSWPDAEIDHDIVLAAATSTDRSAWVRALNRTLKELKAQAPTSGWLVKSGGRKTTGFAAMLARDKRRWFVLTQPEEEGANATFRYYDAPPRSLSTPARGMVVINRETGLLVDDEAKSLHAFCITSCGASDPKPITTKLSTDSHEDLAKWMKALRMAIAASGGEVAALGDLTTTAGQVRQRKVVMRNATVGNLMQLSKLDEEQLLTLRLKQLHELAAYLHVEFDPKTDKDKKRLVELIVSQRLTYQTQDAFNLYEPAPQGVPKLKTWGSDVGMSDAEPHMGLRTNQF